MPRKPLPPHQSKLTLFALAHPGKLAVASGAVIFAWTMFVVGDWRPAVAGGIGLTIVVGILWGPRGWARRRELRLYDENGDRRTQNDAP